MIAFLHSLYINRKESGGSVTLSFHWFSPLGWRGKSFYAENTDFDAARVLEEDTLERNAFFHDMDVIAEELKCFQKEQIPVLWRPFHESDGSWFWWGAKGPEVARELYKLMFDYYTNRYHPDNLLWVWNCRSQEGYPGDEYVDVISVDIYLPVVSVFRPTAQNKTFWLCIFYTPFAKTKSCDEQDWKNYG